MSDSHWYKDAIVYQLHVRCFFDRNDDGIGDFAGLIEKLDYIQELGVTALWLQPFYPSPLRDDGYDIADYTHVHPDYGTLRDFKNLVREAHRRGLRVLTELVINHTSDQHPWFQAARSAPAGSARRAFYVWSDTDTRFPETRIIFTDTESSNWAWDPVAKAYYWHRFFSHQPDLNHNNPRVVRAVTKIMHHWLRLGVDGLRLDAIPYLCVREGTNNENLPETHEVIRQMRAAMDASFDERIFLAEANQWPEDACKYFGDGDECHMAFHFPLMPRIYIAVAQEDRHPITEIMRQTPAIPDPCQWAIFLRNHDELTLEMVTDRERDYAYGVYATEPRMRCNVGIRRRLAPLMENDRSKIELLNFLLMTMPGTPILYYGDEIGMGDNIYLGDRNGVRTPMQWSIDRNGGFSRADPAKLYLPPNMDPVYGYQAVNVEAQQRSPSSLLNWMRRLIAVRQAHRACGRGSIEFLFPGNRKILAYLRQVPDETLLCVANLSRNAQSVELHLQDYQGRVPVELFGRTSFPPIGELPYLLTLEGYGFYWFELSEAAEAPPWHEEMGRPRPDAPCLVITGEGWDWLFEQKQREVVERDVLPVFLEGKRWFAGKEARIERTELIGLDAWGETDQWMICVVRVHLADRPPQLYLLPLTLAWDDGVDIEPQTRLGALVVCKVRRGASVGVLYDALRDEGFVRSFAQAIVAGGRHGCAVGELLTVAEAQRQPTVAEEAQVRWMTVEQSNSSMVLDEQVMLKVYRYLREGLHPELEMGHHLTSGSNALEQVPTLFGGLELRLGEERYALAVLQRFITAQGDGWSYTIDLLHRLLDACVMVQVSEPQAITDVEGFATSLQDMRTLGRRIAGMHCVLAEPSDDPAFAPEVVDERGLQRWADTVAVEAERTLERLAPASEGWAGATRRAAGQLLAARGRLLSFIGELGEKRPRGLIATRIHGDLHLGQVLVREHDFFIVDFEGEVARPLAERRTKHSPLRDVAGMLRSLAYASHSALRELSVYHPEREAQAARWVEEWERSARAALLAGYDEIAARCGARPPAESAAVLRLFEIEKALYELRYEMDHRPGWVATPLAGLLRELGGGTAEADPLTRDKDGE